MIKVGAEGSVLDCLFQVSICRREHSHIQVDRTRSAQMFDAVILDMQLPRLRGDDVFRALRDGGVMVPILALSAEALSDQQERGLALGFTAYLTKPLAPSALRAAVNALTHVPPAQ